MNEYKNDVSARYRVLDLKDYSKLHQQMQDGSTAARDTVIESCLPLVIDIAKKFAINNKHIDVEDFIQEGNIALIKAVDNWDASKGHITTIATYYIQNTLINMIHDAQYRIKTPYSLTRGAAKQVAQIKSADSTNIKDISTQTGIPESTVKKLHSFTSGRRKPYYQTRRSRTAACEGYGCLRLNHASYEDPSSYVEEQELREDRWNNLINLAKNILTKEEKNYLFSWYGINTPRLKLRAIAKKMDSNIQSVRKKIRSAESKLKKAAKEF